MAVLKGRNAYRFVEGGNLQLVKQVIMTRYSPKSPVYFIITQRGPLTAKTEHVCKI